MRAWSSIPGSILAKAIHIMPASSKVTNLNSMTIGVISFYLNNVEHDMESSAIIV